MTDLVKQAGKSFYSLWCKFLDKLEIKIDRAGIDVMARYVQDICLLIKFMRGIFV